MGIRGRGIAGILALMFGPFLALFGLIMLFAAPIIFPAWLGWLLTFLGLVFVIFGLSTIPGTRQSMKRMRSILEIVAVEKEVSISDLHQRTGVDAEEVRLILTEALLGQIIFGYIEDDVFVRDISARPHRSHSSDSGLSGLGD